MDPVILKQSFNRTTNKCKSSVGVINKIYVCVCIHVYGDIKLLSGEPSCVECQ